MVVLFVVGSAVVGVAAVAVFGSVRARSRSVLVVTTAFLAMGLGAVVWLFRAAPPRVDPSPPVTSLSVAPPPTDETVAGGAPASQPASGRNDDVSGCPAFAAYRDAAVAAQRRAIVPPERDEAERRAYATALERLRTALPALGAEIETWDRVEQRWIRQMQLQRPGSWAALDSAALDSAALDDPAFDRAVSSIEQSIWRECERSGSGNHRPPPSPNPGPHVTAPR